MGTVHGGLVVVSKHALSPDVQQERIVSGLESVISFFQLAAAIEIALQFSRIDPAIGLRSIFDKNDGCLRVGFTENLNENGGSIFHFRSFQVGQTIHHEYLGVQLRNQLGHFRFHATIS